MTTEDSSKTMLMSCRRMRPTMGAFCSIEVEGRKESLSPAVECAFESIQEIERSMHPTRSGSDIQTLMQRIAEAVEISPDTWRVIELAQKLCAASEGVFDPCLPTGGRIMDIELLANSFAMCRIPFALDLGGIAKGFAVDKAIATLKAGGCQSGIVNIGGDLRVFGSKQQSLYVRAPDDGMRPISLRDAAIAVSNVNSGNAPPEHRGYYMRTNERSPLRSYAAIQAPTAAIADALTKCAFFCTPVKLDALLQRYEAKLLED